MLPFKLVAVFQRAHFLHRNVAGVEIGGDLNRQKPDFAVTERKERRGLRHQRHAGIAVPVAGHRCAEFGVQPAVEDAAVMSGRFHTGQIAGAQKLAVQQLFVTGRNQGRLHGRFP
ncbi:hypothetical protein D1872_242970 [compost metagenome]